MSFGNRSIVMNRLLLFGRSNGRSLNKSAKVYFSSDPNNSFISDYDRNYTKRINYGTIQYSDPSNPIKNIYGYNLGRINIRNTGPRSSEWNEEIISKMHSEKDNPDLNSNEQQQPCGGDLEENVQNNTFDGNCPGDNQINMHRNIGYEEAQMSSHSDGNDKGLNEGTEDGNFRTTYGASYEGDKQIDTCEDEKEEKLTNLAPFCLTCGLGGPCPSRCTLYDSRKFKMSLPKDDVNLRFENIPNIPTGVFRNTDEECLGLNNAAKCSCYQNPEYFSFHNMTFFDMHLAMRPMRQRCPKSERKP